MSTSIRSALVLHDVGAWQGARTVSTVIAHGLSLLVEPGVVLGVVGPNGSGKTTLLRAIAGVHEPMKGLVRLPHRPGRRPRVAIVPQSFRDSFFPWASVRTNLALAGSLGVTAYDRNAAAADSMLRTLGVSLDPSLRPSQCSDGMLQQAAIARALASEPDLLLADEPFSALDADVAWKMRSTLRSIVTTTRMVAVFVLHDLASVVELCDRVLVIPDKPYSNGGTPGCAHAHVLENRWLLARTRECAAEPNRVSFHDLMRRVLAREVPVA